MTTPEPGTPGAAPSRRASPTRRARRIGGLSRPSPGPGVDTGSGQRPPEAGALAGEPGPRTEPAEPIEAVENEPTERLAPTEATASHPAAAPAWVRWLPAGALGLAALIMLVFFLIVSHGVWWGRPSAQAVRDEVLAAAKSCTVATNTWHYNTFAADEARGAACTTGTRTTDYLHAMRTVVKPLAGKLHASQVVQVNYAGISDVAPDGRSWNVLVVGQLTIRQSSNPQGRQDPFAALVQMDDVRGHWLMSRIQEVAGPAAK